MRHIDKNTHEPQALGLINDFMSHRWVDDQGAFVNISYNDLRNKLPDGSDTYRHKLEEIISTNQDCYCCYCMRKIGEGEMRTLEHLIPDGLDGKNAAEDIKKYNEYIDYHLPFLTEDNVELAFVFKQQGRVSSPPYPHDISYHNLVLSCDGKYPTGSRSRSSMTCNNHRKQKDLCPVFFDSALSAAVEYDPSGEIIANVEESDDVKEKVMSIALAADLSYRALRAIRHLWYLLRHAPMAELETLTNSDDLSVSTYVGQAVTGETEADAEVRKIFNSVQIWRTFLQYSWFKEYYTRRYPNN